MKQPLIHAFLALIVLTMHCPPAIADQTKGQTMQTTQKPVLKNAQDFIEFFREGGKYYDKQYLPNLMTDNRPDPEAMRVLGEALATDTRDVRRKIIALLKDIGNLEYPKYELRTPEVIDLMIGPGFAKLDAARSDAMGLLSERASTATLSRYGDVFLKELKENPERISFLLIAKAKPRGAWKEVDRLSRLPERKDDPGIRIARAALGDTEIEDKYIDDAKQKEDAGDAKGLVKAFKPLVYIGTQRSLRAVCQRMRSPLVVVHSSWETSMPYEVAKALLYAFPEDADLLSLRTTKDGEEFTQVEAFCTKKVGAKYGGIPRPRFFTSRFRPPVD
ncbi:MAG: hypothetical protein LBE22_00995 [Azoarcus sp.]|jgi:hypothetical protein|nr:hypothetical protein [Azoarcus sp.]